MRHDSSGLVSEVLKLVEEEVEVTDCSITLNIFGSAFDVLSYLDSFFSLSLQLKTYAVKFKGENNSNRVTA